MHEHNTKLSPEFIPDAYHVLVPILKDACANNRSVKFHLWGLLNVLQILTEEGYSEASALLQVHVGAPDAPSRRRLEHILRNHGFGRRVAKTIAISGLERLVTGQVRLPPKGRHNCHNNLTR